MDDDQKKSLMYSKNFKVTKQQQHLLYDVYSSFSRGRRTRVGSLRLAAR